MKAWEIADLFRGIFAADGAFAGVTLVTGQSSATDSVRPSLSFDVISRPIGGSADYLTFQLIVTAESEAHDTAASAHAALVEKVRVKFFGTAQAGLAVAKAAIKTAVNASGKFTMLGRGCDAPAESDKPAIEENNFKTVFVVCGSLKVLAPV